MQQLKIYLAGAIRDKHYEEDRAWREQVKHELRGFASFLDPMAGKTQKNGRWEFGGMSPTASMICAYDFWAIDNADGIIFNFQPMASGYPSIGTLVEFGRATVRSQLVWSIVTPDFTGHDNPQLYRLHPFIERNSAVVFTSLETCIAHVRKKLESLYA